MLLCAVVGSKCTKAIAPSASLERLANSASPSPYSFSKFATSSSVSSWDENWDENRPARVNFVSCSTISLLLLCCISSVSCRTLRLIHSTATRGTCKFGIHIRGILPGFERTCTIPISEVNQQGETSCSGICRIC